MGEDKALVQFHGTTLLEHSIRILQSAVHPVVVACGQADRYLLPGVRCIADGIQDRGPLGGILAALEESSADAVLILACDLPFVTPGLLHTLSTAPPADSIVLPASGGELQPLCGRYPRSLKPALHRFLAEGRRKVMDFVESQNHHYIVITPDHPLFRPSLLANINTPEQLAQAEAAIRRNEP
ncbi:MAG: molybdenum cofactor guanylyltransferase [Bacteroidetes bacterium]|nr:molybdenum cofactor guanylyltransferase [Bacteroidota bacterium]